MIDAQPLVRQLPSGSEYHSNQLIKILPSSMDLFDLQASLSHHLLELREGAFKSYKKFSIDQNLCLKYSQLQRAVNATLIWCWIRLASPKSVGKNWGGGTGS